MTILCLLGKHKWNEACWYEHCPEIGLPGGKALASFKFKQYGFVCSRCEAKKI